ncbi:rho GTPase-activating protein 20-like isoform X2 [Lissotriton helveticus]
MVCLCLPQPCNREITVFPTQPGNGLLIGAFCSPNSVFLLDERIHLTSGLQTQERHLFLFSDSLIIAKSKSSSSLKLKKRVRLCEMWIGFCLQQISDKSVSSEYSFVIGWPTTNYIVTFSSSEAKEKWLSTLQWQISEKKREEDPQILPVNVLFPEADDYTSSTMVNVSNTDSAEKIIKMSAQQLGIPGRPSDYHLCVVSGKDDSPYPLLGHEYPFSIIMNCLRDFADQCQGTNNFLQGEGFESFLVEKIPKDSKCQFILKPRPQAPMQMRREFTQKHSRRKKSLIDWALRRSGSSPGGSPASHSPTTRRKLFGLSLSSVCPNGSLPKPIIDMLMLLYHEGPSTKGIFRRSANAKTCKELKEKLNSGDDVHMDGESVFVAAAVITDFLRNIPDSVLSSDMYGLWMETLDMQHLEPKTEAIKRLLERLPEANIILLKHLFQVLYHIQENSEENQMTAFNLALCIAPNMLWLPTPTGPEEESKSARKVAMLVQFLIEHSQQIFGDESLLFFGRTDEEEESRSSEDLAGIHLLQHQDSSDELEFAASDLERPEDPLRNNEGELFGASSGSLLDEEREDWDLFSEIAACYQNKSRKHNSTDSYDKSTFNSIVSKCALNPTRDRCSSEPSVCMSSQLPVQTHEPVARQSSCDATIMRSHVDYIQRLKQLQLESQKLIGESLTPGTNRTRKNFWRSPQTSSKIKHFGPQKNTSNRSSLSSLSSSTPSPSVSSLSSLDSAFSYCSESSVFSPTEVSSLPFMFGTSARLHTLSPENSKKVLKEWHMTLPFNLDSNCGDLDSCSEYDEKEDECSSSMREAEGFSRIKETAVENQINSTEWKTGGKDIACQAGSEVEQKASTSLQETSQQTDSYCASNEASGHTQRGHRETSVKHIEIKKLDVNQAGQDSLKRTKIAFYMAPNILHTRSEDEQEKPSCSVEASPSPNSPDEGIESKNLQAVEVQIPQTVFYGQNTPLVLHSVSRKHRQATGSPQWQTQWKHTLKKTITREKTVENTHHPLPEDVFHPPELPKSHGKSSSTFSHTIRIILPASVRNTVKEYFKHSESKNCSADVEAVESELIQTTAEWRRKPCTDLPKEALETVTFAEETFV